MKDEYSDEEDWQEEMKHQGESLEDILKKPLGGMDPKEYFEWKNSFFSDEEE